MNEEALKRQWPDLHYCELCDKEIVGSFNDWRIFADHYNYDASKPMNRFVLCDMCYNTTINFLKNNKKMFIENRRKSEKADCLKNVNEAINSLNNFNYINILYNKNKKIKYIKELINYSIKRKDEINENN